jgi:3-mercaptopyruvate sulfurtransferase SseA
MTADARNTFREVGRIVMLAAALGLVYNTLSPHGIPLIRTDRHTLPAGVTVEPSAINITEARQLFEQGNALFLDARHDEDFMLGHISGARSLPLEALENQPQILSGIPKDALLVTYCGGEDCASSTDLAYKLAAQGYTNVRIFFAGWREWLQHNLPVETGPPQSH